MRERNQIRGILGIPVRSTGLWVRTLVTGRLNIVDISEFELLRERNGRAGCADGHRLPSIRRKTHECGERTKPLELRSDSRLSGKKFSLTSAQKQKICALIGSQRLRALSQAQKQPPRTKEHAYIQRCYYVSRP